VDKDGVALETALAACGVDVLHVGDAIAEQEGLAAYLTCMLSKSQFWRD
jgi:hypothetical protein